VPFAISFAPLCPTSPLRQEIMILLPRRAAIAVREQYNPSPAARTFWIQWILDAYWAARALGVVGIRKSPLSGQETQCRKALRLEASIQRRCPIEAQSLASVA